MKNDFILFIIVMLFIWCSLLVFFWLKADEVTKDPCLICAVKTNSTLICTATTEIKIPVSKFYYPNGTINNNIDEIMRMVNSQLDSKWSEGIDKRINFSLLNVTS